MNRAILNAGCAGRSLWMKPSSISTAQAVRWISRLPTASVRPAGPLMLMRREFYTLGYYRDSSAEMTLSSGLPRSNSCKTHAKARLQEVLTLEMLEKLRRFWFKHLKTDEAYILPQKSQMGRWFFSNPDFDEICARKYRPVLEAIKSARASSKDILSIIRPFTPLQWLSLVLLLDQVPRNVYRGSESSIVFELFDPIARDIAQHAINAGAPTHNRIRYRVAYRMWFYLPFMHSEDLALHDIAVEQYQHMKDDFEGLMADDGTGGSDDQRKCWGVLAVQKESAKDLLETNYDFEMKHRDIIEQFGRYPHRNLAMGRSSTPEERDYLENGVETFGSSN